MSRKTVVELDLVGYSRISRLLEESVGVEVVGRLNEQIQGFVDSGLSDVGVEREQVVFATTGDGAILVFDVPNDAHRFAVAVHKATQAHNTLRSTASAKRWFRVGVATGDLHFPATTMAKREIAGTVIANAVRLEAAGRAGQIVIDINTFESLSPSLQASYGPEETVSGKGEEKFRVRRCTVVVSEDNTPSIQAVLSLFDRLNPRDQLDRLALLLGVPPEHRPPRDLTLFRRQDQIVDWAQGQGVAGVEKLNAALNDLIRKQSSAP